MINRFLCAFFLFTCMIALAVSAEAQVTVLSHTTVENGTVVMKCQTSMQDANTIRLYPFAATQCTFRQNSVAIQISPVCFGNPVANCSITVGEGIVGNFQTTGRHGLVMTLLAGACVGGVDCLWDPFSYATSSDPPPANRQFQDSGTIFPGNVESFSNPVPDNDILIATTAETPFQSAQITPIAFHARAGTSQKFALNGALNAIWTLTGVAGTTTPAAPFQGTSIIFNSPSTVPVQEVDTLTGCKVDISHGEDCNSAQIFVEVLHVSIDPADESTNPPTNPDELLGGKTVTYNATVTQGGLTVEGLPVTWTKTAETSGGSFVEVSPEGVVTVQPQTQFQGADFFADIQATTPIDPKVAVSGTFAIHIPTATVQLTPPLGVPPFEAIVNKSFDFSAVVKGPTRPYNQIVTWSQSFIPTLNTLFPPGTLLPATPAAPNLQRYFISSAIRERISTTILACVGGSPDQSGALQNGICDSYLLQLAPPVFPTTPAPRFNSGESTPITISGTGFGSAPILGFNNPNLTFTPGSITGPDANGITTIQGTILFAPVPADTTVPLTITSSLPPPSTPATQNAVVRGVSTTPAITPVNPTLIVSQSQQFTPSLACQTAGGQTCTVPQTFTCSLFLGPGTMSASCLYTAPASLASQTQVQARACFTFGNICSPISINLTPISVVTSPAAASLISGQSQQFQATVTNAPNNNQGVTWSISPAVGAITAAGLYTAPAAVTSAQSVSVTACSVIDATKCSSSTVTLVPPDFGFSAAQNTALITPLEEIPIDLTVSPIGGFTGNVILSATLPTGIGMSSQFSPATITTSGSSVATFPILASTPVGSYPVTITATSGGLVHSVQVTVTVAQPTLSLTVSPPQTVSAGQTVTYKYDVEWTGFFGSTTVNVTGFPPGSTITPTPIDPFEPGTSSVIFTTPANLASGTYNLTFTATGGGLVTVGTSSLNVSLTTTASTSLTIPAPPPPRPPPPPICTGRFCNPILQP